MANQLEPVVGRLVGDNSDYIRSLNDAERRTGGLADDTDRHFGRMGNSVKNFAKVAAFGLAGAAVGVGAFLKASINAAEESRKVGAQTEAVIKSTGGVANVSAGQVAKYADSLAALTGIDDEAIASGQNLLLTFTNVRNEAGKGNDVFNQGTKAALNMSVALKQDLQSSSMLVGKALNDPIKGVTALTRSGIQFTEQQKAQIKAMTESGNVLGAQKIILKELETQFGGSAEAAASPMERLKVVVGNLQEQLGARFLPIIGKVAGALADKLPRALDTVGAAFSGLFSIFGRGDFTGGFEALGIGEDSPVINGLFQFRKAIESVVAFVKKNWPEIRQTIDSVMKAVQSIIKGVIDIVTVIWRNFGDQITDYVQRTFRAVMDIVQGAMQVIQGIIKTVTSLIRGDWSGVWEGIKQIVAGAWQVIQGLVDQAMNMMQNAISVGMELVRGIFGGAWNAIFEIARRGVANIVDAFLGMVGHIIHAADSAFGWIPGIGDKLHDARVAFDNFRDNVNRSLRGIEDKDVIIRLRYLEEHGVSQENDVNRGTAGDPIYHSGGIVHGPLGSDQRGILQAGEGVFTRSQMAALGASLGGGSGSGSAGGNTYVVNVYTATGDIPDETMRKIRSQLFEMENDMPAGQIIPAA